MIFKINMNHNTQLRRRNDDDDITPTNYHLLHTYWNRAKIQAKAHGYAEDWYRKNNRNFLKLPSVVCGALATILGAISYGRNDCNTQTVAGLWITSLVLVASTTLLSATENVLNWDTKRIHHHESVQQYSDLVGDIELFMSNEYTTAELKGFVRTQHEKMDIYGSREINLSPVFVDLAKAALRNGEGKKFLQMTRASEIIIDVKGETG